MGSAYFFLYICTPMKQQSILTEDGSHTLFVPELQEHYHSTHGAVQESRHVYIDAGLKQCKREEIKVIEIGFGTGLNTLLTLLEGQLTNTKIHYTGLEHYPIDCKKALKLNYAKILSGKTYFEKIHQSAWNQSVELTPFFNFTKLDIDCSNPKNFFFEHTFDVIYFDAFAPDKQPEMWQPEIFDVLYKYSHHNAILTTYCAKGSVRRMMQSAGFKVERLPGPPGKREMLRARKIH